ncbi:3-oxoacyl-[acyl-carrier-protein] synthase II [Friedmanniella endophytica]|uniref:3-oxoacyl-[acyl-carrier-protein] synthase 2 n=1 Tax=Microlunatus kandeliicorticis TaxID=1759536 RepID=A0A7W3IV64_9ACTN|nr:beta-ketoacyl-[acyl-carrier-protein] synthase family protein [Microlunatus kandeliicorticis]MBA8795770.1 3-oxoacyl-[acyl-carrier-protein] synthase II [Microlunatus kandeliicorticis]
MSRSTVVVTGLGATTPLGGDVASTWEGMLAGRSGVSAITADWAADLASRIAGQLAVDPAEKLERVEARRLDRFSQVAVVAAREAWEDAGFGWGEDNPVDRDRLGVSVATGIGGMHTFLGQWDAQKERGPRRVSPLTVPMLMANAAAANISLRLGARATVHTPVSACASSNEALSDARDMIELGRADVVVAGGAEACVHPFTVNAFSQMQAMSRRNDDPERASRPWDTGRDGFVLAEGSAIFVLERLEHAQARGARIYGVLAGAGITADAYDIVQPDPSGTAQAKAMKRALAESGLEARDIVHVNAHATSTPAGDGAEAGSIREALGQDTTAVVTATKSMTGHLLGGAGALESMATLLALHDRKVPPTINLDDPEPGLGIDIATSVRELPEGDLAGINNSFGFGGHNVAVAFTNQYASNR